MCLLAARSATSCKPHLAVARLAEQAPSTQRSSVMLRTGTSGARVHRVLCGPACRSDSVAEEIVRLPHRDDAIAIRQRIRAKICIAPDEEHELSAGSLSVARLLLVAGIAAAGVVPARVAWSQINGWRFAGRKGKLAPVDERASGALARHPKRRRPTVSVGLLRPRKAGHSEAAAPRSRRGTVSPPGQSWRRVGCQSLARHRRGHARDLGSDMEG